MDNVVKVNIYGQEILVRGQTREDTIVKIAKYVDGKVKEVEDALGKSQPAIRVVILAAMNIAGELMRGNQDHSKEIERIDKLIAEIDSVL